MESTWEVHGKSGLLLCVNVTKYADYAYNITVYYVAIIMRSPRVLKAGILWDLVYLVSHCQVIIL